MRNGGGGGPCSRGLCFGGLRFFHLCFGFLLFGGLVGGFGLGVWSGTTVLARLAWSTGWPINWSEYVRLGLLTFHSHSAERNGTELLKLLPYISYTRVQQPVQASALCGLVPVVRPCVPCCALCLVRCGGGLTSLLQSLLRGDSPSFARHSHRFLLVEVLLRETRTQQSRAEREKF